MLDRHLEPDDNIEYRCECGECVGCNNDWEFDLSEPSEREIAIAEHNYECLVYNERDRMIWR